MIHNFRELLVWKKSMGLCKLVYAQTKSFPQHELYALTSQIQRAVVSIPTNIAEGSGRATDKELCHFLKISLGSAYELETELTLAYEFGYICAENFEDMKNCLVEIQKMLDVIRNDISQNVNISGIINHVTELYDFKSVLNKISHKTDWSEKMLTEKINGKSIKILHLSDLHFTDEESMNKHLFYLKIDLKKSLKIRKVDYLIITGDVCDKPVELMYKAAASFVIQLTEEFKIPKEHVILTIGNHDCDREMSKKARPEDKIIDQEMYNKRFIKYNDFFYEPIKGKAFSMEPTEQFEEYISIEDKICFLSLNSCWLIDHIDTTKSAICIETIQNSKLIWLDEDEYLKLAMWHHPISGEASIQDAVFMDTLATTGFKACFHGHIHEAKSELFNYDDSHSIKMIGAGTFGAVQKERGDGIPRQYNLVEYNKSEKELIIHTRKREKDDGVWQADARWGEKDLNPKAFYKIKI